MLAGEGVLPTGRRRSGREGGTAWESVKGALS